MNFTAEAIRRPRYESADLAEALRGALPQVTGCHLSQKMDGQWSVRSFAGGIYTGEAMRAGRFYVFDAAAVAGQDVRHWSWIERRAALLESVRTFPAGWALAPEGHGPEFIQAVIAAGGEGVVAKDWHAPFGTGWTKIKRVETHDCTVTEMDIARGSIRLSLNGEDCGWCPARAAFHSIRLEGVVEVAALGRHASGKFREASFVRVRSDKICEVKP